MRIFQITLLLLFCSFVVAEDEKVVLTDQQRLELLKKEIDSFKQQDEDSVSVKEVRRYLEALDEITELEIKIEKKIIAEQNLNQAELDKILAENEIEIKRLLTKIKGAIREKEKAGEKDGANEDN